MQCTRPDIRKYQTVDVPWVLGRCYGKKVNFDNGYLWFAKGPVYWWVGCLEVSEQPTSHVYMNFTMKSADSMGR